VNCFRLNNIVIDILVEMSSVYVYENWNGDVAGGCCSPLSKKKGGEDQLACDVMHISHRDQNREAIRVL
jgi:hypothetical protein